MATQAPPARNENRPGDWWPAKCREDVLPGYHYLGGRLGTTAGEHAQPAVAGVTSHA